MSLTKVTFSMIEGAGINPTDYGVVGDGATDDAAAMQLAINAAVSSQLPLVLAPTTYKITASVLSATLGARKKLVVYGNGAVFNTTIADAANVYDGFFTINGTATSEVIITDFSVTSDQSGSSSSTRPRGNMVGLAIKTMGNAELTNVSVSGFAFINIWLYYLERGLVLNCQGINAVFAGLFMQSCLDTNVIGGVYNQNGGNNGGTKEGYGVSCATKYQVADRDNARVKIDGITAINNIGKGIDAHDCLTLSITNNYVRGFGLNGIYAVNEGGSKVVSDVTISGNYVSGSGGTALASSCMGIEIGTTSSDTVGGFIVSNNIIRNIQNSTSNNFGVFVQNPASGVFVGRVVIDGNSFEDAGGDAGSVGSVIRFNNNGVYWPSAVVTNNAIYQSVAVSNGVLGSNVTNLVVSNNIINTTTTMAYGITPDGSSNFVCNGNLLEGTFTSADITVFGNAYQIGRGNMINGTPFRDFMDTGATVDWGTAAPVAGYWYQGSVRWNRSATVGQPKGWQCTVAGTPGTWVSMGNL